MYATEVVTCGDAQTESSNVCFEKYVRITNPTPMINIGVDSLRTSCKCCTDGSVSAYDTSIIIDCNECGIINFEPIWQGENPISEIIISEDNPVENGTLTAIESSAYLFKFCPETGFTGDTSFGFQIKDELNNITTEKTVFITVRNNCVTPPVPCDEQTITVSFIDTVDDTPITAVTYPINVMSPFSTDSGTNGELGDAGNYAAIISILNADTNKPVGITFATNADVTKINIVGVCEFQNIKLGDSIHEAVDMNTADILNLTNIIQDQQLQINYLMAHLYDCCAEPPAPVENPFAGTEIELCNEVIQGRITYLPYPMVWTLAPGISAVSILSKALIVPTATPNIVISNTVTNMVTPTPGNMRDEIANVANTGNKYRLLVQYTETAIVKTGYLFFDLPHFDNGPAAANSCTVNIPITGWESMYAE